MFPFQPKEKLGVEETTKYSALMKLCSFVPFSCAMVFLIVRMEPTKKIAIKVQVDHFGPLEMVKLVMGEKDLTK